LQRRRRPISRTVIIRAWTLAITAIVAITRISAIVAITRISTIVAIARIATIVAIATIARIVDRAAAEGAKDSQRK